MEKEDLDHNLRNDMKNTLRRLGFISSTSIVEAINEMMNGMVEDSGASNQIMLFNNQLVDLKKMLEDDNK